MKRVSKSHVGQRIRSIRGKVNQTDFAKMIGVRKQNYVSRYEHGRIPNPELLVRIANYGKVTVDWLLTGRGKGPKSR
ncbi:MAG TPA: helix-turn-helix transcriptional regulator [Nitrospiria bacterium]|jgi:transcriptional regulator with XRE-family HTH domain|nr:helix-turn-helix transcriptional regulator [Nitrospiria bacterium]